jgi:hypothetical protein
MQSGFRRRFSTESAILRISSDIFERLGKSEVVMLLALDFSKAFDTVNHEILLCKLEYHGVRDTELLWFKSYLSDRTQQVNVNGIYSSSYKINTGVPQGSILSPFLYIIFTADMPHILAHARYYCYADDTQLLHSGPLKDIRKVKAEVEEDFSRVGQWAAANLLKLNADKTQFLLIKGANVCVPVLHLQLQGQAVAPVEHTKILGIIFDSTMSFTKHGDYIAAKVTGFLRMIAQRRNKLPRSTVIMLVNSYVSSRLSYCLSALGSSSAICEKFQLLQNFAVRTIFGLPKFSHVSHLRNRLNWLSIKQLADMRLGLIAHRAIHGSTPAYLRLNLSAFLPSHAYFTRNNNLRLPIAQNRYSRMTFEARGVRLYNRCKRKEIWAEGRAAFSTLLNDEILRFY